jgi:CheY-like chemotaxis protein
VTTSHQAAPTGVKTAVVAVKNILVVDDDPHILTLLSELLSASGFHVETASTGEAGLEMIRKTHFDVMLCDVWMPSMSGLEVLMKLQDLPDQPPVIMMTADDAPETTLKAVRGRALQVVGNW